MSNYYICSENGTTTKTNKNGDKKQLKKNKKLTTKPNFQTTSENQNSPKKSSLKG